MTGGAASRLNIRKLQVNKFDLAFNPRSLVKAIELPSQLNAIEKEDLKERVSSEKKRYMQKANTRFDSSKNWSIMIKKEHNEVRNDVMRKFKFGQLKKNFLHDFIRPRTTVKIAEQAGDALDNRRV